MAAEMPRRRAGDAVDHRVPDPDRAPPFDLKSVRQAHDVDRIRAAAARAFETDRHGISFSARVNLPKAAAASAKRTVCGRADNPGSRTPYSRAFDKSQAPGTRRCPDRPNGSRAPPRAARPGPEAHGQFRA